jgi:AbrB family looped-hinge helix DNA binding protein
MPEGGGFKSGRVGERGQVSIEKAIRDQLGIHAGDRAVQRVEDGRVVMEFIPAHTGVRSSDLGLRSTARWSATA